MRCARSTKHPAIPRFYALGQGEGRTKVLEECDSRRTLLAVGHLPSPVLVGQGRAAQACTGGCMVEKAQQLKRSKSYVLRRAHSCNKHQHDHLPNMTTGRGECAVLLHTGVCQAVW